MPVARRDLREQAEHGIAEIAAARDQLPGAAGEESIRLRVVELTAHDRRRERLQLVRVHLVVAGHHRDRVDSGRQCQLVAGDDRCTDPAVAIVRDDLDTRVVGRARTLGCRIGRGVVDDEDPVDEAGNALNSGCDQLLFVVRRHDDGNALTLEHGPIVRRRAVGPPLDRRTPSRVHVILPRC